VTQQPEGDQGSRADGEQGLRLPGRTEEQGGGDEEPRQEHAGHRQAEATGGDDEQHEFGGDLRARELGRRVRLLLEGPRRLPAPHPAEATRAEVPSGGNRR